MGVVLCERQLSHSVNRLGANRLHVNSERPAARAVLGAPGGAPEPPVYRSGGRCCGAARRTLVLRGALRQCGSESLRKARLMPCPLLCFQADEDVREFLRSRLVLYPELLGTAVAPEEEVVVLQPPFAAR